MNWQAKGDWFESWSSVACPSSRGLLRAVHAIQPPLPILVASPLRHSGARPGMENPQPQGSLGEMIQTVLKRRKGRAEEG
jgi:hypothetical protein